MEGRRARKEGNDCKREAKIKEGEEYWKKKGGKLRRLKGGGGKEEEGGGGYTKEKEEGEGWCDGLQDLLL